jgi:hypothetical protein
MTTDPDPAEKIIDMARRTHSGEATFAEFVLYVREHFKPENEEQNDD